MVVLMVSDIVEPGDCDSVECEMTRFIVEVLLDDESGHFCNCHHMSVSVCVTSAGTNCVDKV